MLIILGLIVCTLILSFLFCVTITKKEGESLTNWFNRLSLPLIVIAGVSFMLSFSGGLYLALQLGKNFPTFQRKVAEEECAPDEMGRVFVIATYEPVFMNKKHNMIAIPTNKRTKKVYQKK